MFLLGKNNNTFKIIFSVSGKYVGVEIFVTTGKYDEILRWPIRRKFSVHLMGRENRGTIRKVFKCQTENKRPYDGKTIHLGSLYKK